MSWIFLFLSALGALGTSNALWPLRRPWWLKLPSFNMGWFANELPVHVLAGNVIAIALFTALGALDERPGQVGLALTIVSSAGLLVLAGAHRRAGAAMIVSLRDGLGSEAAPNLEPLPWFLRAIPGLAWVTPRGVERVAGVVYATAAGRDLKLDVYRPASRPDNCPVLLEIHGGGWMVGDRRFDARPLMARMARRGWVCVSIDYRLSRRATWPDHIVDVKTALAWVRERAGDYGGDADYVVVTGGSAGGHLAALAALSPNDPDYKPPSGTEATVRACVSFYGVYDFDNSLGLRTAAELRLIERHVVKVAQADDPGVYARAAPLARVTPDAPPFMVVQGTSDNLVFPAESRAFVAALRSVSTQPVVYAEIPRGHHAFDAVPSLRTAAVISGVERFLAHCYSTRQ